MYTRCPNCNTVFRVTEQQLQAAAGKVRCGRCATVFDANEQHIERADSTSQNPQTPHPIPARTSPETEQQEWGAATFDEDISEPEFETPPGEAPAQTSASAARSEDIPEILEEDLESLASQRSVWPAVAWSAAIVLLAAVLVFQYAYFMRGQLAQYDAARPWLERMCGLLDCEVPLKANLSKIRLLSSDVLVHPRKRDTLLVQTSFANTATYTQPFPILEIKLSDVNGNAVAMRRFKPGEYLDEGIDVEGGMQPQVPVNLRMEVVKPESEVSGYEFDFH